MKFFALIAAVSAVTISQRDPGPPLPHPAHPWTPQEKAVPRGPSAPNGLALPNRVSAATQKNYNGWPSGPTTPTKLMNRYGVGDNVQ